MWENLWETSGKIWQCGKAIGKPTGSENDLLSNGGVPEWCKRLQEGPIAFLPMFEGMKIYKSELWGEQKATGRVLVHIPMNKLLVLESFSWSFKNHLSLLRSGPSFIPNPTPRGRCASMRGSCRTALLEDARSRLSPRGPRNVWTVWTPLELPGSPTGRSYESEDLCHQGISAGNMSISWSKDASTIGCPAANADSDIVDSGPD